MPEERKNRCAVQFFHRNVGLIVGLGYWDVSRRETPERQTHAGLGFGWLPPRGHELLAAQ
jgi:hypothetical protein